MYFSLLALPAQRNFVLLRLPDDDSSPALKSHGFLVIGIKNPLVKALAASQIVGELAGKNDNTSRDKFNACFVSIRIALNAPRFLNKFPNTWAALAKQSLDGILNSNESKKMTVKEINDRNEDFRLLEGTFKESMPRRGSTASRLGGWFREYCSISKLVLKARSASMTEAQRYDTAMKLARSLQGNSRLDPRDVCLKIGIVLQSLSGKEQIAGQPEKLLAELSKTNVTVAMVNDEIISRVPNLPVERPGITTGLRTMFMKGLADLKQSPVDSLGDIETRTAFDPATVDPVTTARVLPTKTGTTSTATAKRVPGNSNSTTTLTDAQKEKQKREEERRKRGGIRTEPVNTTEEDPIAAERE